MILYGTEIGAGRPVALLHGLFGDHRNLGSLQRALGRSRRAIALDLRNHGGSVHADGMSYRHMAEDVIETLTRREAWPADVVGHSMGGKTAMAVALARPDLVTRLVVADIAPVGYPPRNAVLARAMRSLDLSGPITRAAAERALAGDIPEEGLRRFLLRNLEPGETPRWRLNLAALDAGMDEIEGFDVPAGRYEGPALFLLGGNSPYVRPSDHDAILERFPLAGIVTIPEAGHWLHVDQALAFQAAVGSFLGAS